MRRLIALTVLALGTASAQPKRIVSTAPSLTEALYAAGLGSKVVGVTTYCRFPEAAQKLPKIGTFLEPDFERILALRPDLVLTLTNPVKLTERLRSLKLNAVEVDMTGVEDVFRALAILGKETGATRETAQLAATLRRDLNEIRASTAKLPPRSVLFVIGRTPGTLEGLIGAGRASYLDELLTYAGGRNILADSPMPYPKVSLEDLFARNPDVILDMGDFAHAQGKLDEKQPEIVGLWSRYSRLSAVRSGKVYALASDIFVVPGPRMIDAAKQFRRYLHPEAAR